MKDNIFKSYDIRGIYDEEFNKEDVRIIARAYLQEIARIANKEIKDLKITISRDIRYSSPEITETFIDEVIKYGVDVDDLGLMPIDAVYYLVGKDNYDGGIMVTASHNPPKYGGIKMLATKVEAIRGVRIKEVIQELKDIPESEGSVKELDIWDRYVEFVLSFVNLDNIKPLKVVVDSGNAMAGISIPKIFSKVPQIEVVELFFEPDANFPSRDPNPLNEGAADKLIEKVKEVKADLGAIFDADSDRVFLVDETGEFIKGDQTLILLAENILKDNPGAGIVYNLICSKAVPEIIEKLGGKAIRSEVGYANVKKHMEEENGIMGGEVSGHFSFKKNYYSDCAYAALLMILEIMSVKGKKLSELVGGNMIYYRANELNIAIDNIPLALDRIREEYKDNIRDEIDGITVEFNDWWFNVRASNTEPLLRITVEANDKESAEKYQKELLNIVQE